MKTRLGKLELCLAVGACAALLGPASALAGKTYFAAPSGGKSICSEKEPCTINKAVEEVAEAGDNVILAPGTYTPLASGLTIPEGITVGGSVGAAASTILVPSAAIVTNGDGATLHDLTITGKFGLSLRENGSAERIVVSYSGKSSSGCGIHQGAVLRDSVCWAHDGSTAGAILAESYEPHGVITLDNVTAVNSDSSATAIYALADGAGGELTLNATNVIAVGNQHPDVEALRQGGGVSTTVVLTHSNFDEIEQEPPAELVTSPGTNGNQTAPPVFVNAAIGDFHELFPSPTIGAGLVDPAIGAFDLDGRARTQPGCDGTQFTDIGAYQLPQALFCPPDNHFSFGKLKLDRRKGTATLAVVVPGAGALSLSGKGLKPVKRAAKAAGTVKLPLIAVGKARQALKKSGKRRVVAKVTFTPSGGSAYSQTRKATLHRELRGK